MRDWRADRRDGGGESDDRRDRGAGLVGYLEWKELTNSGAFLRFVAGCQEFSEIG